MRPHPFLWHWFGLSLLALSVLGNPAGAGSGQPAGDSYPALRSAADARLQTGLEQRLAALHLDAAVRDGRLAVALVDISELHRPRLAAVNGERMLYAASLPKIAILLGAFEQIENGDLPLDAEVEGALTRMIRHSSNRDATAMMERVGPAYIAEVLQSPRYRLYDPAHNGGLWVGKVFGKSPAWRRDPLHNISHGASALQVARFYYLMATGRLVSPGASARMQAILGEPAIAHKFVKGLAGSAPEARLYRKSGSWKRWHADSALVEHGQFRYIAVALAESPRGGAWLEQLIVGLDDLVCGDGPRLAGG